MSKNLKYRIKEFKNKHSLTYEEIGDACRRDRNTVRLWCSIEQGSITSVPSDSIRIMAQLFGCTMEELHTESTLQPA